MTTLFQSEKLQLAPQVLAGALATVGLGVAINAFRDPTAYLAGFGLPTVKPTLTEKALVHAVAARNMTSCVTLFIATIWLPRKVTGCLLLSGSFVAAVDGQVTTKYGEKAKGRGHLGAAGFMVLVGSWLLWAGWHGSAPIL